MTNEYIIDEDIANKICTVLVNCGENRLANKLCSRPAPSHSECYKKGYADAVANALSQHADCVKCLEEDRVTMLEHDAAIRKAEREQVLDEFIELWQTNFCVFPKKKCSQDDGSNRCPVCIAKSLRGGA